MKKVILAGALLIGAVFAGAGIWLATYDFDRLRPLVTRKFSEAAGSVVRMERVGLSLRKGLALTVTGLEVDDPAIGKDVPELRLGRGHLLLEWAPLLRREIRIGAMELDGADLTVIRDADGSLGVLGIHPQAPKPAAHKDSGARSSGAPPSAIVFFLDRVELKDARIRFVDRNPDFSSDLIFAKTNFKGRNIGIGRWMSWEVETAFCAKDPNLSARGVLKVDADGAIDCKSTVFKTDFAEWEVPLLVRSFSNSAEWGIEGPIKGRLEAEIQELKLPKGETFPRFRAKSKLSGGEARFALLPGGVRAVEWDWEATDREVQIHRASAALFGGEISGKGKWRDYRAENAMTEMSLAVKRVRIGDFAVFWEPLRQLQGVGSLEFSGSFEGLEWPVIAKTLTGKGKVDLESGVILAAHPLKSMIEKLGMIPGLKENLDSQIPPHLKARVYSDRTVLIGPVHQEFVIQNGRCRVAGLNLPAELFNLQGSVEADLAGSFGGEGSFVFGREISQALLQSARGLDIFSTPEGALVVPFFFEGEPGRIAIRPDLGRLKLEAVVERGKELMRELFQKVTSKNSGPKDASSASTPTTESTSENKGIESLKDWVKEFVPVDSPSS